MSTAQDQTEPQKGTTGGSWSLQVAVVDGIPVRIHITFLFLLAYAAYIGNAAAGQWLAWVVFILGLFFCVVLHELGHALTAKRFGIQTRDITLYPIGGVALFEGRMRPSQEFWIALAGPMVNVAISILLSFYFLAFKGGIPFPGPDMLQHGILYGLLVANIALAIFNMIPAFPMDGGRVLRAFLGLMMPEAKATAIAGTIGQMMAVVLGIIGFFGNILLVLVAVFVFLGAGQEMAAINTRTFLEGHRVAEAMLSQFYTLAHGDNLQRAADLLIQGSQHDFPVLNGEELMGILTRVDIARGLAEEGPDAYVAGFMNREFASVNPKSPLEDAVELFNKQPGIPLLVLDGEVLVGMLTPDNLSEFIMLQAALRNRRR